MLRPCEVAFQSAQFFGGDVRTLGVGEFVPRRLELPVCLPQGREGAQGQLDETTGNPEFHVPRRLNPLEDTRCFGAEGSAGPPPRVSLPRDGYYVPRTAKGKHRTGARHGLDQVHGIRRIVRRDGAGPVHAADRMARKVDQGRERLAVVEHKRRRIEFVVYAFTPPIPAPISGQRKANGGRYVDLRHTGLDAHRTRPPGLTPRTSTYSPQSLN